MMKTMAIPISIASEEESSRSVFSTVHVIFGTRVKNDPLGRVTHSDSTYHLTSGKLLHKFHFRTFILLFLNLFYATMLR